MIAREHKSKGSSAAIVSIACVLLVVAFPPSVTSVTEAALPALPPRPTAQPAPTLPPRPSKQPTLLPPPAGGFIELRAPFTQAALASVAQWQELWAIVQWQDSWGKWHNVEGWQGTFDEFECDEDGGECEGKKVWWVAREDFDKGPFRWVVYQGRGGNSLAQSDSFHLPHFVGQTVRTKASLVP